MSVAFLDCSYLKDAFGLLHTCCEACHEKKHLIYVRPENLDGSPDWFLCVEAVVCCNLYHFAKSISRNWWESKAVELGVNREDQRGYIFPSEKRRDEEIKSVKPKTRRAPRKKEEEERSFADFLKSR